MVRVEVSDAAAGEAATDIITSKLREFTPKDTDGDPATVELILTAQAIKSIQDYAVDQNRTSLNNRVNELGVGEPVVQRQGTDRIVVQLPGIQDAAQARRILGRTATLEFRLVAYEYGAERAMTGVAPPGTEIFPFKGGGRPVILRRQAIVTGDEVTNAQMGFDPETNSPQVSVTLDGTGARQMQRVTGKNVGNPMSVLFVETKSEVERYIGEDGVAKTRSRTVTENM